MEESIVGIDVGVKIGRLLGRMVGFTDCELVIIYIVGEIGAKLVNVLVGNTEGAIEGEFVVMEEGLLLGIEDGGREGLLLGFNDGLMVDMIEG
jgi:hypothetical protein